MANYSEGMTSPVHYTDGEAMIRYDAPHDYGAKLNRYSHAGNESPWMVVAEIFGGMGGRGGEMSRYRGQPRTSTGRFKSMRYADTFESEKEHLAATIAEECEPEELLEKIIKESSEVITAASSEKIYDVFKEFAELAILICAFAEHLPDEMVNAAGDEALEYWERKFTHKSRRGYDYNRNAMHYSDEMGRYHEGMRRMYRSRRDDYEDNPLMGYERRNC